jgi:hypothetical protein
MAEHFGREVGSTSSVDDGCLGAPEGVWSDPLDPGFV